MSQSLDSPSATGACLVADMVDSVGWQQRLGSVGYAALQHAIDTILREAAEKTGGTERVEEREGDLRVVIFPSFARALEAALRFQKGLARERWPETLAGRVDETALHRPAFHIGVAIGYDGRSSKEMAAAMQELADDGQILAAGEDRASLVSVATDSALWGDGKVEVREYGRYAFARLDGLVMPVAEIGWPGVSLLKPPLDKDWAWNEASLWRPKAEKAIPNHPGFLLERKLGEGGFGEVWLARSDKGVRTVFKFCFNPDRLDSLRREKVLANLLASKLNSAPNIVPLRGGELETPPYFLESAYVEGGDLLTWLAAAGGPEHVPLEQKLALFMQVCDAVEFAHTEGIVHKDIKPGNILIDTSGDHLAALLADFGIGCLVDTDEAEGMAGADAGDAKLVVMAGSSRTFTRLYEPPEYSVGSPPTRAGDIYSLGVVLFQLVANDMAHAPESRWERRIADPGLREAVAGSIAVEPEKRFPSARRLKDAVASYAARSAVIRRHRLALATVAVVFLLSLIPIGYWIGEVRTAKLAELEVRREAERQKRLAEELAAAERRRITGGEREAFLATLALAEKEKYVPAMYNVSIRYMTGLGVDADSEASFAWMLKAAEGGNDIAQYMTGEMYLQGVGVGKNERESLSWMTRSAEAGNVIGQYSLGKLYIEGSEAIRDPTKGLELLRRAADQGLADAEYEIGACYLEGNGVAADLAEAARWFALAAAKGNGPAQYQLGTSFFNGEGVARDLRTAEKWWLLAANQKSKAPSEDLAKEPGAFAAWTDTEEWKTDAAYSLGRLYSASDFDGRDLRKAAEWYKHAAEAGHMDAQFSFAEIHRDGEGVPQDSALLIRWLRRAAAQGHGGALVNLGLHYYHGDGVKENKERAVSYFRIAADEEEAEGQYLMGESYRRGIGVKADPATAFFWYRRAAMQDHDEACEVLGDLYVRGIGVESDPIKALIWYKRAAQLGNDSAMCSLGDCFLSGRGTEPNRDEARRWFQKAADMGNPYGAYKAAVLAHEAREPGEALSYMQKAADMGMASAAYWTAVWYHQGVGSEVDPEKAFFYYLDATEGGEAEAMHQLGHCYFNGFGTEKNDELARKYLEMASKAGVEDALSCLQTLFPTALPPNK